MHNVVRENDREKEFTPLKLINSVDLTDMRYPRIEWIADGLLKPGLSVLAGAPKIGKSWLVLQLCLSVAKGEPFWGMKTRQGTVLYITLEDSEARIQERILRMTDESSENLIVSLSCSPLGSQLKEQLLGFYKQYPQTRLVVIDTFQKVRDAQSQMSYANDYADVSALKRIADELRICILLVHHTRKMGDSDCINEISGTNGIAGSADTLMILKKEKRTDRKALLSCTGRDIEDRELELMLDKESCVWRVTSDSLERKVEEIPQILLRLIAYVGQIKHYDGSNTEFCEGLSKYCREAVQPNQLKRQMNRFRYELEDAGVYFASAKSKGYRRLAISYHPRTDGLKQSEDDAAEEAALWG